MKKDRQHTLFKVYVSQATLDEIRMAINKAWVLGSDYFKDLIENQRSIVTKSIESDPIDCFLSLL